MGWVGKESVQGLWAHGTLEGLKERRDKTDCGLLAVARGKAGSREPGQGEFHHPEESPRWMARPGR